MTLRLKLDAPESAIDVGAAQNAARDLLIALGFDPSDEDFLETPRRVAATLAGMVTPPAFEMTTFANEEHYDGLVLMRAIPFHSLCRHHLLPFIGVAHVGYLPGDRIVGLSKLVRVVEYFARSLQTQERLTAQIANSLHHELKAKGVGVVLEAEHLCMSLRGVQKPGTRTATSMLLGTLRHDHRAREEFFTRAEGRTGAAEVRVSRREAFSAAHQLCDPNLPDHENRRLFGKCVNLHGHNYVLEVAIGGKTDPSTGYVADLKQLSELIGREIIDHVDHRNLNTDVPWLVGRIPTAENLAVAFWERLAPHLRDGSTLRCVKVWETEKNCAEYSADR